jgi:long-chain fatty acid transport protein
MTSQYPAGNFSTTFAIPAQLMAGASWQPLSWFTAAADIEYSTWSQFKSLDISYSNPSRPAVTVQQLWKNTLNTKFGVEFDFGEIIVRGGIRRQKTPIPTQTLTPGMPDADATGYSVGFGYRVADGLLLDFAYLLIHYADRVVTDSSIPYNNGGDGFNGTYTAQTNAIALNVRYSWN